MINKHAQKQTRSDAKQDIARWLNRGFRIDEEINALMQAKQRAFEQACSITTRPKDIVVQPSTRNSRENVLAKIADFELSIDQRIDKLYSVKQEINDAIGRVEDQQLRTILTKRYLIFEAWEQIAIDMNYSTKHIFKLHEQALSRVDTK